VRVHLVEIPFGRLFREVEHLPGTDHVATSVTAPDGARLDLIRAADDRVPALLATLRHDVAKVDRPIDVVAQPAPVLTAAVLGRREARPPAGVLRKVVRSQTAPRAKNEASVGIDRAARFEQKVVAPPLGARRAGRDLALHFETNPEAGRPALRGAPLPGEVHLSERLRRPLGVARQETHLQYQAAGVRSSLRIDQIASLGTARRIARPRAAIFLEAQVQGREGRRVREQEGQLPAIGDQSRASRMPRVRDHSSLALLVAALFVAVRRLKSRVAKMTD
jgi:hypothetical protein